MTPEPRTEANKSDRFDYRAFIAKYAGATAGKYTAEDVVFAQGDPADAAFYIVHGDVVLTVISEHGKEAVLALLTGGDFFGEECFHTPRERRATVAAATDCEIVRFDGNTISRALGDDADFVRLLRNHVLEQNEKLREHLTDQLFNSSEKRLARILLTLANAGRKEHSSEIAIPVTQELLANMVGTTRPRINQFMTKFRRLGYIEYDGKIRVHDSLVKIVVSEDEGDSAPLKGHARSR